MPELTDTKRKAPAAKAVKAPTPDLSFTITDDDGRTYVWRECDLLETGDLMLAAGSEATNNGSYMEMAMICSCVREIDGNPYPFPANLTHIRSAIRRVGTTGYQALRTHLIHLQTAKTAESEEGLGALKNS
jgi:hypothetical protein